MFIYLIRSVTQKRIETENPILKLMRKLLFCLLGAATVTPAPNETGMRKLELWHIRTGRNIGEGTP
jgi:hypothetical protein